MTHHGHFMQRGLPVEHHKVVVLHVSLHFVADLQVKVTGLGVIAQIYPVTIVADDILGPGVLVGTSAYQLTQSVINTQTHTMQCMSCSKLPVIHWL